MRCILASNGSLTPNNSIINLVLHAAGASPAITEVVAATATRPGEYGRLNLRIEEQAGNRKGNMTAPCIAGICPKWSNSDMRLHASAKRLE